MICIKDGWSDPDGNGPAYLEEVFVIKIITVNSCDYYKLGGYQFSKSLRPQFFNADFFIPCSDMDETVIHDIKPELQTI